MRTGGRIRNFGFAGLTFRSEMKRKQVFICISLTYFVTLPAKIMTL